MNISVPTHSGPTLAITPQQSKSDPVSAAEDPPTSAQTPQAVERVMAPSDLAAIQLSQLHALALSLGQSNPDNFAKPSGPDAIPGPSTMDIYA